MTKIAFITTMAGSPWGGSEYLWAAAAEQALSEGHEVLISLYQWSVNQAIVQSLQRKGAKLFPRSLPNQSLLAEVIKRGTKKISKHFRILPSSGLLLQKEECQEIFDHKPDVICISQGSCFDIYSRPELLELLNFYLIPYLVICQLNIESYLPNSEIRAITKEQFINAAYVAFVSQHNLRLAERQLAQSLPNAVVVQNPVNMQDIRIVPYPQQSIPNFAVVARLEAIDKGQDLLFEALSFPEWRYRDWQCNLYGSGESQSYLKVLAGHYGIADRVKFAGHVSDVRSIWAENHLLVLPSRCEGTPLSLIEAMLCGRPSVVTDVGGNTEWIEEAITGFIAEAATATSISNALEKAWAAQEDWESIGIQAHEYATAKFDPYPGKTLLQLIVSATRL